MHSPAAVVMALANAPDVIVPLVREVPRDVVMKRPAPGKWSAHEHACHLADVHPLFFERLELMMKEERPRIAAYHPEEALAPDALMKMDLDEALERFTEDRRRIVARLKELAPADWLRAADHEEYDRYSIFVMFRHLALHDYLHAYRIEELLLKKDWGEETARA